MENRRQPLGISSKSRHAFNLPARRVSPGVEIREYNCGRPLGWIG